MYIYIIIAHVVEYKYLGCIINQHVESRAIVDSRTKAGARALCAWLKSCRISVHVREVKGESFVKLLEVLVGSVLVYIWRRCGAVVDRWVHLSKFRRGQQGYFKGWGSMR